MIQNSKYAFFGTPEFAAIILEKLIKAGFRPEIVVCNPDKPIGRKKIITSPPIKKLLSEIKDCKIKILQPEKLEIRDWKLEINKLDGIDFALVAAYSKIISKLILDSLPAKFIGIHPSLLPKYRGPSPIQTAILNNENVFGTTLYLMDEKIDHGPTLANSKFQITNYKLTYEELNRRLAELGADLLIETLPKFLKKEITPLPQDESQATYTQKFTTEHGFVDLKKDSPIIIERKIRALNPEPGVYTFLSQKEIEKLLGYKIANFSGHKRVKLLSAEISPVKKGFSNRVKDDKLILLEIQVQDKKPSKCRVI